MSNNFQHWNEAEFHNWLKSINLDKHYDSFTKEGVSADILVDLTEEEIAADFVFLNYGDRKRLKKACVNLLKQNEVVGSKRNIEETRATPIRTNTTVTPPVPTKIDPKPETRSAARIQDVTRDDISVASVSVAGVSVVGVDTKSEIGTTTRSEIGNRSIVTNRSKDVSVCESKVDEDIILHEAPRPNEFLTLIHDAPKTSRVSETRILSPVDGSGFLQKNPAKILPKGYDHISKEITQQSTSIAQQSTSTTGAVSDSVGFSSNSSSSIGASNAFCSNKQDQVDQHKDSVEIAIDDVVVSTQQQKQHFGEEDTDTIIV